MNNLSLAMTFEQLDCLVALFDVHLRYDEGQYMLRILNMKRGIELEAFTGADLVDVVWQAKKWADELSFEFVIVEPEEVQP